MRVYLLFLLILLCSCDKKNNSDFIPTVEVRNIDDKYVLYRNGQPYYINGAAGHEQMEKLSSYGGNSIRTWGTQNADSILDAAHKMDITVTLGLEVGREWWGDDFNYWDYKAVDQKIEELKEVVRQFKDHPALLIWGIGNEVQVHGGNNLLIFIIIDRIAKMIHEEDPNHPVMTTVTLGKHFNKRGLMRLLCPNLDILGVNSFSRTPDLYNEVRKPFGWNKAYMLTELGSHGPWDSPQTQWGAPKEPSSTQKAETLEKFLNIVKQDSTYCLGSYAFYWGHKFETTHTYMSLFTVDGLQTESVNVLRQAWSDDEIKNRAPLIDSLVIHLSSDDDDDKLLIADSLYVATIYSKDVDNDLLTYKWELKPEGKNHLYPGYFFTDLGHLFVEETGNTIEFRTPKQEGPFRLFSYVFDNNNHVATHNLPFYVLIK